MSTIGFDLDTTYYCVDMLQHGKMEIIANDQGNRTTASYAAFTDSERLIGNVAKNQVAMNPNNTIFNAKCRKYDFPKIREEGENDKLKISVGNKGKQKRLHHSKSIVLTKMKEMAGASLKMLYT